MTIVSVEPIAEPLTWRETRRRADAHRCAAAELAERRLWCAPPPPAALEAADVAVSQLDTQARGVRPSDIVLVSGGEPPDHRESMRELGAHVVWLCRAAPETWSAEDVHGVDAIVTTRRVRDADRRVVDAVTALLPAADILLSRAHWSDVLATIVAFDRDEVVGGRLHARPFVAVR